MGEGKREVGDTTKSKSEQDGKVSVWSWYDDLNGDTHDFDLHHLVMGRSKVHLRPE